MDAREVAPSARGEADRVLAYAFFACSLQRQPSTPANDKPSFLGHLWHKAGRLHGIGDNRGTSLCFSSVVFRVYRKKLHTKRSAGCSSERKKIEMSGGAKEQKRTSGNVSSDILIKCILKVIKKNKK